MSRRRRQQVEEEEEEEEEEWESVDEDEAEEQEAAVNNKNAAKRDKSNLENPSASKDSDSKVGEPLTGAGAKVAEKGPPPKKDKPEKNIRDPATVPRKGQFFLHDDRGDKSNRKAPFQKNKKSQDDDMEWKHDKFEELMRSDDQRGDNRPRGGSGRGNRDRSQYDRNDDPRRNNNRENRDNRDSKPSSDDRGRAHVSRPPQQQARQAAEPAARQQPQQSNRSAARTQDLPSKPPGLSSPPAAAAAAVPRPALQQPPSHVDRQPGGLTVTAPSIVSDAHHSSAAAASGGEVIRGGRGGDRGDRGDKSGRGGRGDDSRRAGGRGRGSGRGEPRPQPRVQDVRAQDKNNSHPALVPANPPGIVGNEQKGDSQVAAPSQPAVPSVPPGLSVLPPTPPLDSQPANATTNPPKPALNPTAREFQPHLNNAPSPSPPLPAAIPASVENSNASVAMGAVWVDQGGYPVNPAHHLYDNAQYGVGVGVYDPSVGYLPIQGAAVPGEVWYGPGEVYQAPSQPSMYYMSSPPMGMSPQGGYVPRKSWGGGRGRGMGMGGRGVQYSSASTGSAPDTPNSYVNQGQPVSDATSATAEQSDTVAATAGVEGNTNATS
eukprot:gene27004-32625_t